MAVARIDRDSVSIDGTDEPGDDLVVPAGSLEPVDDGHELWVLPLLENGNGSVDVAVVIGQFEEHPIELEARAELSSRLIRVTPLDRGHRSAVCVESLLSQGIDEVIEGDDRPARGVVPELRQPATELRLVGPPFSAGARIQVDGPLAGLSDHARRVVGVQERLPHPRGHSESRGCDGVRGALVEEVLQLVEEPFDARGISERLSVVEPPAGAEHGCRRLLELLSKVLVTARGKGRTGLHLAGRRLAEGRHLHDELSKRFGRKRAEVVLHGGPSGVAGRRTGRVEDGEANRDEVLAEVARRRVRTGALAVDPIPVPAEIDDVDPSALHRCRGAPAFDAKPSNPVDVRLRPVERARGRAPLQGGFAEDVVDHPGHGETPRACCGVLRVVRS